MDLVFETKRIVLRPVEDKDLAILTCWMGTKDYLELVSSVGNVRYHTRFVICLKRDNKPIGVLYTFSYNKSDGYMFFNIFLSVGYRKMGYGAEACTLAICNIFDLFTVYKIYCDTFSTNTQSILMMKGANLKQEGLLKGHRLYNGVRYDVYRFAVYRGDLLFLRKLLAKFLLRKREISGFNL